MIFRETDLAGVVIVDLERLADERGTFARSFCEREFGENGLTMRVVQCNVSTNPHRGTLRGLHYQAEPRAEPKLVTCTRGRIYDVAVDVRPQAPTFCRWVGVELDAESGRALYIAAGYAHGFQTLTDDVVVSYLMGEAYDPSLARGVRWNDPAFAIHRPLAPTAISERDAGFADIQPRPPEAS